EMLLLRGRETAGLAFADGLKRAVSSGRFRRSRGGNRLRDWLRGGRGCGLRSRRRRRSRLHTAQQLELTIHQRGERLHLFPQQSLKSGGGNLRNICSVGGAGGFACRSGVSRLCRNWSCILAGETACPTCRRRGRGRLRRSFLKRARSKLPIDPGGQRPEGRLLIQKLRETD